MPFATTKTRQSFQILNMKHTISTGALAVTYDW